MSGQELSSDLGLDFLKVIHLAGDITQPLHNIELFNQQFKTGDEGGNKFNISCSTGQKELHALWDDMGNVYKQVSWEDSDCTSSIEQMATELQSFCSSYTPPPELQKLGSLTNPWDRSFALYLATKDTVYKGLTPGGKIPSDYLNMVRDYSRYLVYMAGQHMATSLAAVFSKSQSPSESLNPAEFRLKAKLHNHQRLVQHFETLHKDKERPTCCCGLPVPDKIQRLKTQCRNWIRGATSPQQMKAATLAFQMGSLHITKPES